MKLTAQIQLHPTPEQADTLRQTLEVANRAANAISAYAWQHRVFRQYDLHHALYYVIKAEYGLTAQMVVRLLSRVSDSYKADRKTKRTFGPHGAIAYDDRIIRWSGDTVSIWTVAGRKPIPFVCGERQRALLDHRRGECDLVLADGKWYLLATCEVEEQPPGTPDDWLGVDLGVTNIAVDSDGTVYSGGMVRGLRHRHRALRKKFQARGTRSAKRLLKKRRRREFRFARDVNHCISKRIVADAKRTGRGVALEELGGIRERVRLRRHQRAAFHSWSFFQLRAFIAYKAKRDGVVVVFVDPKYTSQTCSVCGYCDKKNRNDQATFLCGQCGFAGHADHNASINIGRRAAVMLPYAAPVSVAASRLL